MEENLDKRQYDNLRTFGFDIGAVRPSEILFCFAILSVFIPIKIYPVVFLVSALAFYFDTAKLDFPKWSIFLTVFGLFALISFIAVYDTETSRLTNIIKLLVNFVFLYFAVTWISRRDNQRLIKSLDLILHLIFILVFLQLLYYHQALDFRLIGGSTSSGQASMLYNKDLYIWGVDDKNMFGARIAMIGFPYILIPLVQKNRVAILRIIFIFGLGYLSMSRTPIVALIIGCGYLLWISSHNWMRIAMIVFVVAAFPFVLQKIIRIDQLTSSNDGMGTRLVYWKAFFQNLREIPIWGIGFEKAPEFMQQYSEFYRGEPHIHNTFLNSYLELGIVGLLSFASFLFYFVQACFKKMANTHFWIMVFLPLIAIMMILYSGYDNDIILYLALVYLLGTSGSVNFKETKLSLI
ncbi:O-antigen ligase family protein [Aquiflexum sp. TKW24L]|uniref:O-antigen ligase family protein n=1 Tax=Aquiflexum sp. TKW24L TaxID=2942212 RepID=UPI0020C068C8|nr:O-antigen ligase family protein [Aquiflexum sp. TKW24L]MCL6260681.1 O-antigen ligase family protein [Aquiflexum sp. TKW24L]